MQANNQNGNMEMVYICDICSIWAHWGDDFCSISPQHGQEMTQLRHGSLMDKVLHFIPCGGQSSTGTTLKNSVAYQSCHSGLLWLWVLWLETLSGHPQGIIQVASKPLFITLANKSLCNVWAIAQSCLWSWHDRMDCLYKEIEWNLSLLSLFLSWL